MKVFICSPNLDQRISLNGISANTLFIMEHNTNVNYIHFEQGKRDNEKRSFQWLLRNIRNYFLWVYQLSISKESIIHYNLPLNKPALKRDIPFLYFAFIFKKKTVIHLHGGIYLMDEMPEGLIFRLIKILLSGKHPIIVLSEKEKHSIEHRYNAKEVYVLPNCISVENNRLEHIKTIEDGILNILFLGRIVSSKGFEYVYHALEMLINEGFKFRFLLAGDGDLLNDYLPKFRKLLGKYFEYMGVVTGEEKQILFKRSHIFILPSISGEGLPISLIEAMYHGLTPIITDDGSMATLINDGVNGFIVPKRSSVEIKLKLIQIIANPFLIQTMGNKSKEIIKDLFNPEHYMLKLNKIYSYA